MKFNISGKTALITGSSKGIGFEIAKTLHDQGCLIAINSRNKKEVENKSKLLNHSIALQGDVTIPEQAKSVVARFIENYGKLDFLICNVGSGNSVPPGHENIEEWRRVFDSNLFSATNMIEASSQYLQRERGNVVCISSICGKEVIKGAPITYSVAKAALNAYVKGISIPLAKKNVRINAIVPGNIFFKGSTWEKKLNSDPDFVEKLLNDEVPLKSFGSPQDIANLVCYLVSPISGFMTGSLVNLDGGQGRS